MCVDEAWQQCPLSKFDDLCIFIGPGRGVLAISNPDDAVGVDGDGGGLRGRRFFHRQDVFAEKQDIGRCRGQGGIGGIECTDQ